MRVLALDYGSARCGAAISDPSGTLARPLPALEAVTTRRGLASVVRLIEAEAPERVVVGLPLSLDGSEGEQAKETREFVGRLRTRVRTPVELHDERLTTAQADRTARGTGTASDRDSVAAAHLLESYLAAGEGIASR